MAKGEELIEKPKARTIQELMVLDPEELTSHEVFSLSLENIMLVSSLTAKVGAGRIYRELFDLKYKIENEEL